MAELPLDAWLAIAALAAATLVTCVRVSAARGKRYPLRLIEDPENPPEATELIVLAHGLKQGAEGLGGIRRAVREVKPQAHIVSFDYNRHLFSNASPFLIAERMDDKLDALQNARSYQRIVLVGYSMGALLVRKALVYGCGSVEDLPSNGEACRARREPRGWVKQVERLVLLAGMNRGWSGDKRPADMPWRRWIGVAAGMLVCKWTHTGLLIRQCMKGQPFVSNLRLQWLEVMRQADRLGIGRPSVIQFLGDTDDVVSSKDSRDVTVARDFIWVKVPNTGHRGLVEVEGAGIAEERKQILQQAFGDEGAIARLKGANSELAWEEDASVRTVVCVLHGIRDIGGWTSQFEAPLKEAYQQTHPPEDKLYVDRASYGFFAMGPFLLWADRQRNVRWFMDQVTELTARFPNLREIHFIGHSNGTYVLASALEKYKTLKVGKVVLAGSVIRRDYRWSDYSGRVGKVRNYVGSKDYVVGLFPRLFELSPFNLLNGDIGSAGFNGFEDGSVKAMETQFVRGGHDAALVVENISSIVDFIIHEKKTDIGDLLVCRRPALTTLLSNVCWLVWLVLVLAVLWAGWKAGQAGYHILHWFNPEVRDTPALEWSSRAAYVALVWLLLRTL
jgi:pimeloyl-ACP methyl ester carboxylesterase